MTGKPRIGLIPGDPAGVGPELAARLLADPATAEHAQMLLVGDACVFELGREQAGAAFEITPLPNPEGWEDAAPFAQIDPGSITLEEIRLGEATEAGGRSVLRALDRALDLALEGSIDAILFTPFNKASLHMAGLGHEDELQYVKARLGLETRASELNTMDGIWSARVTSHIPLSAVAGALSEENIVDAIVLTDRELRRFGLDRPRISVAALNPHAGDGGNFGREEIDLIRPAVEKAAARQIAVDGPWPSDTVFLKAKAGEIDAVVTMYHDQGQIALKLMGFDRGVTVLGGLPVPIGTPAHGTAFDIVGTGRADMGPTKAALEVLRRMNVRKPDVL